MKKYIPLVIIIVVLGGALGWYIWRQAHAVAPENAYAVKDEQKITKIILVDTQKNKIELNKVNGVWIVNGKFPARGELIQSLLQVITRVTILCPVARAAHDNIIREMIERNIKVDIYTGGNDPVKTYYVGGPSPDGEGTYMLMEKNGQLAERPDITYIPGVRGYLAPRYSTDEENWRGRVLFNYTEAQIKRVEVEYPDDEQSSFIINRVANDSFTVQPVDEKYRIKEPYLQKYIHQYLDFYSSISFEAFDTKYPRRDSTMRTTPFCIITITPTNDSVNEVKLFHMPITRKSHMQYDEKGNPLKFDIEHFHASINGGKDWVITQYYVLGKILRSYRDFYFKPQETNYTESGIKH